MRVPQHVDEITPEWMGAALRAGGAGDLPVVAGVRTQVIGSEKGFLSQTVRVEIAYAGPPSNGAPSSVVVKLEPEGGSFREAERGSKAFDREIRFYRELAARVPLRLARVYYGDASDAGKVLVMEDLSAFQCIDQLHGLRHEQVIATARDAAKLHAAFWNDAALAGLEWLPLHDHFFADGFVDHWPAFAASYELRIGRDAVRLGERVALHLRWLEERISERPVTLVHGDLRADNLLFGCDPSRPEIVLLDWQLATRSLGAIDLARLLGGSEPAAERRGHQIEVVTAWHETLLRAGLVEYEFETALTDFRLGVLYCLFIPVKGFALAGAAAGGRTGRLLDAITERLYASAIELDAGSLLPG
jgi:hypothetical protein